MEVDEVNGGRDIVLNIRLSFCLYRSSSFMDAHQYYNRTRSTQDLATRKIRRGGNLREYEHIIETRICSVSALE